MKKLSAGAVVTRHADGKWWYLLLRVYKNWDFPKGTIDSDENPLNAARREIQEETGLSEFDFPFGEQYVETGPYNRGKVARYYLAQTEQTEVTTPINLEIGQPEHHEIRWLTGAQAQDILPPRLQPVLSWAQEKLAQQTKDPNV